MSDLQDAKALVLRTYGALDAADADQATDVLRAACAPDFLWRGFHPFNELRGPEQVGQEFWGPLKRAIRPLQRRMDLFFAGHNEIDGYSSVWVASMGHLMGLFDAPWVGIAPTGKIALLRYAAFHKIEGGRITETAMFFDIPHLMMQAGLNPFPPQTAAQLVQPGPMTHEGLMFDAQDPVEGEKTLSAITFMVGDMKGWDRSQDEPIEDELRRSWNEDMIWWGPTGIGATYTIERYAKQHAGPFRAAFKDRKFNGHVCRMAEGKFGGFFGWPNLTLTHTGGFMGMPASDTPADMRVIDMYRREGDKLTENWIFIDLLHFWKMQGLDILDRMAAVPRT